MKFLNRTKFKDINNRQLCLGQNVKIYVRNGTIDYGVVVGPKKNPGVKNSVGVLIIEACLERHGYSCQPINHCCGDSYAVFEVL